MSLSEESPLVLWHLLSLDAPTVAVLWTIFTASMTHTSLPPVIPIAMALAVWTLYAADRLLDTRHLCFSDAEVSFNDLEPRHLFHHRHRSIFLMAITGATIGLAGLLPLLPAAATHLYLTEGAAMAGYFLLIHTVPKILRDSQNSLQSSARCIPKELLVGPFFAAAIFIPTISYNPGLWLALLPFALLFACLCNLNCLYIYAWEHAVAPRAHWATSFSVRNLTSLTVLLVGISFFLCFSFGLKAHAPRMFSLYPLACAASALLLLAIHHLRQRLSPLTLRAAADAALMTPLLILPFVLRYRS